MRGGSLWASRREREDREGKRVEATLKKEGDVEKRNR